MVQIEFSYPQEGTVSPTYGPYEFVQLTYNAVRVGPEGDRELAYLDHEAGLWRTDDGKWWTDFSVFQA